MDSEKLKRYISFYDGKQEVLANAMGLSLSRLNAKINQSTGGRFTLEEVAFIKERYGLDNDTVSEIFLDEKSPKKGLWG